MEPSQHELEQIGPLHRADCCSRAGFVKITARTAGEVASKRFHDHVVLAHDVMLGQKEKQETQTFPLCVHNQLQARSDHLRACSDVYQCREAFPRNLQINPCSKEMVAIEQARDVVVVEKKRCLERLILQLMVHVELVFF